MTQKMCGFAPIAAPDARVLVLGSFPGQRSLDAGQYYAHPHNAFWFIMEHLFAQESGLDYPARAALLMDSKIALWDILLTADRPGSLDSAIVAGSEITNDFSGFFARHPAIHTVFFNGATAQTLFQRYVMATLVHTANLQLIRLPSTSPANARLSREKKLELWRVVSSAVSDIRTPKECTI